MKRVEISPVRNRTKCSREDLKEGQYDSDGGTSESELNPVLMLTPENMETPMTILQSVEEQNVQELKEDIIQTYE